MKLNSFAVPALVIGAALLAALRSPDEGPGRTPAAASPALEATLANLPVEVNPSGPHAGMTAVPQLTELGSDFELGEPPPGCPASVDYGSGGHASPTEQEPDPHVHARFIAQVEVDPKAPVARSSARNGRTVAELYAERAQLAGQPMRVRGTVVKLTEGIRGQAYVHLRDGTGSLAGRDNDLTMTTDEAVTLGETAEFEGTVVLDQDLGLGYRYEVLLGAARRL
jgi:hypothetical protein